MTASDDSVIFCFGANHRSADITLREKLFASEGVIRDRLPAIKDRFGFSELVTLSTCNRFEIFGVGPRSITEDPAFSDTLHSAFVSFDALGPEAAEQVRQAAYSLTGRDAVRHLFSVAASLDSLVVGETQITGQFKQALAIADDAKTLGPVLSRLGQEALAASKKVRTQTAIGRGRVSIGHAAVELVKKVFNDPTTKNFLVIGAGEMAELTARCIQQHNPKSLGIINRSLDRARALAMRLQGAEPRSLDCLADALATADVVISATGAPHTIVTKAMVKEAIRRRRGRTLLLVDIAMPRDIDPACSSLNDVYLFDIDDLKQVVEGNRQERLRAAEDAARIIDESVAGYEKWLAHMTVAPALQHFNMHLDQLFRKEAEKTLSRNSFQEFNEEQTGRVWQLLDVLASRLTADAGRGLRKMVDQGTGQDAAELLMRLFRGESPRTEDDPT